MMSKLIEKIKKDKFKIITVIAAVIIFVVGVFFTFDIIKDTYAVSTDGYYCPLDGGYPIWDSVEGYYCIVKTANISTSSFDIGMMYRQMMIVNYI